MECMEPIATSTNTAISIKMSASPLLFTKLHSSHPHFRLEGLVGSSMHSKYTYLLTLSMYFCAEKKNFLQGIS